MSVKTEVELFDSLKESVTEVLEALHLLHIEEITCLEGKVIFTGKFLVSMIGFVGEITGLLSLYCSGDFAIRVANRMSGNGYREINHDVRDAMGELTNIIAGKFKLRVDRDRELFHLSIPSVIDGTNFSVANQDSVQNRLFGFKGKEGTLYVQLMRRE